MRIVYLNPVGVLGGGERSLLDLMAAAKRQRPGLEMSLVTCADGPLVDKARQLGADARVVPMPESLARIGDSGAAPLALAGQLLGGAVELQRFTHRLGETIRALRPDVVHSNGIKTHLLSRACGIDDRVPIIWHVRDFISARPAVGRLMRWAARPGIHIVANSRATGADVARTLWDKARKVTNHVIYNGIDLDEFSPGPGDAGGLDRMARIAATDRPVVRIGLVATYARWKGQDLFLRAANIARAVQPDRPMRFYIVGGPIYRTAGSQFDEAELRELAEELGVGDIVGFVPFQDRPAEVYRALDVVVHASTKPEPFGRMIVEAMACARAVVVTDAGGASELFDDGVDAIGVRPGDADALARSIVRLARDAALRERLGRAGRARAERSFSRERLGREICSLYDTLGDF